MSTNIGNVTVCGQKEFNSIRTTEVVYANISELTQQSIHPGSLLRKKADTLMDMLKSNGYKITSVIIDGIY